MKRHSLYRKFALGYLLFALLIFAVVALFSSRLSYRASVRNSAQTLYSEAIKIAEEYSDIYSEGPVAENMRYQISGLQMYAGHTVLFLSPDGEIVYDSAETGQEGGTLDGFDPADISGYYRTGTLYGFFSRRMLTVQAPVTANQTTYGYALVSIPLSQVSEAGDRLLVPIYITALILFLLSLLLLIMISYYVIVPLRKITVAAGEYASGNLKHKIDLERNDEMGYLATTMNVMAQELAASEDYQKKFISNVSHDFRSPLTSIKGYLGAILDGVIPPENQDRYLRIIINETDRLTKLTQSMLSLNSLNRANMNLEMADFDICALIKSVCETFEGKCQLKRISFDLILSDASIFVHADMGKIQQVIYNLVDNAIKFSDPDSDITIEIMEQRAKAQISVKDYGCGISREDQQKIWTRFFKSDRSRGKDKQGTGLGLSIVKEIITAHGESIDVISTEGVGTKFVFALPLSQTEDE